MQALCVLGYEGLHRWLLQDLQEPQPGAGEVQVRVEANAVSYVDLLLAHGLYQIKPGPPFVPGTEFCGVITRCGPDVPSILEPGMRVTGTVFGGAWAETVCAPWTAVCPVPPEADAGAAASLPITFATALYALRHRGNLKPGETVLVLGAAGGVGLASIQVAKALGAQVIAGAGGPLKCAASTEAGADQAIDTSHPGWRQQVQAVSGGGVDVVVDPVGGDLTDAAFRILRWGGRHLVVGFAEGSIPALRANLPLLKGAAMVGVDVRQFREREPEAARANLADVVDLFSKGRVRPKVAATYPVADWPLAMAAAQSRQTVGRVVFDWAQAA